MRLELETMTSYIYFFDVMSMCIFFQLPLSPLLDGDFSKITPGVVAADGFTYTTYFGLVQSTGVAGCVKSGRASFQTIALFCSLKRCLPAALRVVPARLVPSGASCLPPPWECQSAHYHVSSQSARLPVFVFTRLFAFTLSLFRHSK